jgi:hypothetical protein
VTINTRDQGVLVNLAKFSRTRIKVGLLYFTKTFKVILELKRDKQVKINSSAADFTSIFCNKPALLRGWQYILQYCNVFTIEFQLYMIELNRTAIVGSPCLLLTAALYTSFEFEILLYGARSDVTAGVSWLVHCFTSYLRIFHLYGDVTIAGEGLQI